MQNRFFFILIIAAILLNSFKCKNCKGEKKLGYKSFCQYDDTIANYLALNHKAIGRYTNIKINDGDPYIDLFNENKFDIIKVKTIHYKDTAYVWFKIIGIQDTLTVCIEPYNLISGFKISKDKYMPISNLDGAFVSYEQEEFEVDLQYKRRVLKAYCDSVSSHKK
jgi:hypothetical protein